MPPSAHPGTLLAPFQSLFSAPTWRKAQRLLVGTLLATNPIVSERPSSLGQTGGR